MTVKGTMNEEAQVEEEQVASKDDAQGEVMDKIWGEESKQDDSEQEQEEENENKNTETTDESSTQNELEFPEDLLNEETTEENQEKEGNEEEEKDIDEEHPTPEKLDKKANDAFGRLKHELKEKRTELQNALSELQSLKEGTQSGPEIEELQNRVKEQEDLIGQLDLSKSQSFQEKYDMPIQKKLASAKKMVKDFGLEESIVDEAMKKESSERWSYLLEEAESASGPLISMLTEVDSMSQDRQEALNNWRENSVAIKSQETAQQRQERLQSINEGLQNALKSAMAEKNAFALKSKTNEEWNKNVDEKINLVKGTLEQNDPKEIARLVLAGATVNDWQKLATQRHEKIKSLEKELEKRTGYKPGYNGTSDTENKNKGKRPPEERGKGMSPTEMGQRVFT